MNERLNNISGVRRTGDESREKKFDMVDGLEIEDCVQCVKMNKCISLISHNDSVRRISYFQMGKDERKILFVDQLSGIGIPSIELEIKTIKHVIRGQTTKIFEKWNYEEYENRSISIFYGEGVKTAEGVWSGKSIDMICDSEKERDIFFNSILFVLSDNGESTHDRNLIFRTNNFRRERLIKKSLKYSVCVCFDSIFKPPQILPFLDVHDVVFGENCTFVVTQNGDVYSWGGNHPKLGLGRSEHLVNHKSVSFPEKILFGRNKFMINHNPKIIQVSTGDSHTLFLEDSGCVWGAGSNEFGQLGFEPVSEKEDEFMTYNFPTKIPTKIRFSVITCSSTSSGGIEEGSGRVYVWGDNRKSFLGLGENHPITIVSTPTHLNIRVSHVVDIPSFHHITSGRNHFVAVSKTNNLTVWGDGEFGKMGNRPTTTTNFEPTAVRSAFLKRKTAFCVCGDNHTVALTSRGKVYCWGLSQNGQIGMGQREIREKYTWRPSLNIPLIEYGRVLSVGCGKNHSVAISEVKASRNRNNNNESEERKFFYWGSSCSEGKIVGTAEEVVFLKKKSKFMKKMMNQKGGNDPVFDKVVAGGNMCGVIMTFRSIPMDIVKQCMCCKFTFDVKKKRKKDMRRKKVVCKKCENVVCSECRSREMLVLKYGYNKNSEVCKICFLEEKFPGEKDLRDRMGFVKEQLLSCTADEGVEGLIGISCRNSSDIVNVFKSFLCFQ